MNSCAVGDVRSCDMIFAEVEDLSAKAADRSGLLALARRCLWLALVSCSIVMCGAASVDAQSAPPGSIADSQVFLVSCPPGHRIAFRFGQIPLNVDPRWLDTISAQSLARRYRNQCPTEPVPVEPGRGLDSGLDFNRSVIAAAQIVPPDLGRNYWLLTIASIPPREGASAQSISQAPPQLPSLADVTREVPRSPSARVYQLRYLDGDPASDTTVRISCGGDTARSDQRRSCFTVQAYRYRSTPTYLKAPTRPLKHASRICRRARWHGGGRLESWLTHLPTQWSIV